MSGFLYSNLPKDYVGDASAAAASDSSFKLFLLEHLPPSDAKDLDRELQWKFLLDKHASRKKKSKPIRKKKTFLTRKERKELNILKLPKTEWNYESLRDMRKMWCQYMRQNLELAGSAPTCQDSDWTNFSTILARSELIGSEVKVVRSKVPSHVGISGTLVLETKMTFQIVTPKSQLKIIPKSTSVFEFSLDSLKLTVFGKHIMTKPSERSVKKIKSQMLPDL